VLRNRPLVDVFENILPSHGFEEREGQEYMAYHVESAIRERSVLIAEASVGIGKTFAYLIPALLSFDWSSELIQKTLVISTNTIVLQHQLIDDINRLVDLLHVDIDPSSIALAKGRTNFLCLAKADKPGVLLGSELREWIDRTLTGDRNEAPSCSDQVWQSICADGTSDCSQCNQRDICSYQRERSRWAGARIVVTNHQQLLADALNRELNPRMALFRQPDMVIIDEAHRFEEASAQMLGSRFTFQDMRRIPKLTSRLERYSVYSFNTSEQLEYLGLQLIQKLNDAVQWSNREDSGRASIDVNDEITKSVYEYIGLLNSIAHIQELSWSPRGRFSELDKMVERLIDTTRALVSPHESVCWAEIKAEKCEGVNAIPRDMTSRLRGLLWNCKRPTVLTSGTLTGSNRKDYDYCMTSLGLSHAGTMNAVPSPFDYEGNRIAYLPPIEAIPDWNSEEFLCFAANEIACLARAIGGRTLILMTSHDDMNIIDEMLRNLLPDYNLLSQGQQQEKLIGRFKQSSRSVLLGTAYWEGVDMPGTDLVSVICIRLPFPPHAPVLKAKEEEAKKRSMDVFTTVYLSEMLMKLKQGLGRLIRTNEDFGVFSILDRRAHLGERKYSRGIHDLLAPSEVTHSLQRVKDFVSDKDSGQLVADRV
jgi:ATP-dependent DNA helicase DinG